MGICQGHPDQLDKNIPVIITGINGYVASHVTRVLLERGYKVKGTVRSLANKDKYEFLFSLTPNARSKIELVEANLNDNSVWGDILKGAQAVIHVASPLPFEGLPDDQMIKAAVDGMKAITQAALKHGVKKLIYTSSVVTQIDSFPGPKNEHITEDVWGNVDNMDGYSKSKYHAEKELWDFHRANKGDIEVVTVLPSLVAGPVLGNGNISSMGVVKDFLGAVPGYLSEDSTFAFTGVADLGLIHVKALESKKTDGKRLIANSQNVTSKRILEIFDRNFSKEGFKVQNKETTIEELGQAAKNGAFGAGFSIGAKGKGSKFDDSKTAELLGIKFSNVENDLVDGIKSLIKYGIVSKN